MPMSHGNERNVRNERARTRSYRKPWARGRDCDAYSTRHKEHRKKSQHKYTTTDLERPKGGGRRTQESSKTPEIASRATVVVRKRIPLCCTIPAPDRRPQRPRRVCVLEPPRRRRCRRLVMSWVVAWMSGVPVVKARVHPVK